MSANWRRSAGNNNQMVTIGVLVISLHLLAADLPAADRIVVNKAKRELILLRQGRVLKTYRVALGEHPIGPKRQQGDKKTPEGLYKIDWKTKRSNYHWALHISYPNDKDRAQARLRHVDPGGALLIHGLPNGQGSAGKDHVARDWTWGCVAVTNEEIEEIYASVPANTPIEINPL